MPSRSRREAANPPAPRRSRLPAANTPEIRNSSAMKKVSLSPMKARNTGECCTPTMGKAPQMPEAPGNAFIGPGMIPA